MQTDNFEKCLQNTNIFVSLHMAAVEMKLFEFKEPVDFVCTMHLKMILFFHDLSKSS